MHRHIEQEIELELGRSAVSSPESVAPIFQIQKLSRRDFLKTTGTGVGVILALQVIPGVANAFDPYPTGAEGMPNKTVINPQVFVSIDADGTVTLTAHRSEMGTGAKTNVPMVLADEMEADWDRVKIVQAEGDEPKYGNQDTDGSRSLRHYMQPMRQMGASVRFMLEQAAAEKWGVDVGEVQAEFHEVGMKDGSKKIGYGELAEQAMALDLPDFEQLTFKTDDQFRYMGKGETPLYDLHDITTGKARYGADYTVEGMKFAAVARPPVVGACLLYTSPSPRDRQKSRMPSSA